MRCPVLVLGIGSTLRRDDAAGRLVADALAGRALPGVEVRSVHQLGPEVAADLDGRRLVVFVDASVEAARVAFERLGPRAAGAAGSHHLHPAAVLGLAQRLGWAPREAVAVHVPAADLGLGDELSPVTREALGVAVERVVHLCAAVTPGVGPDGLPGGGPVAL